LIGGTPRQIFALPVRDGDVGCSAWEGEAPAEPVFFDKSRLGGSLACLALPTLVGRAK